MAVCPANVSATICNVIGFDDAPFAHDHRGDVRIFGAVCARTRLDGVVSGLVRRDGVNSTARMIELVEHSQFRGHVRGVLLQGIAVAGFNVVDVHELASRLGVPVVVVSRRKPRLARVRAALDHTPGAARKWRLIERAGPMELLGKLWVAHRHRPRCHRAAARGHHAPRQRPGSSETGASHRRRSHDRQEPWSSLKLSAGHPLPFEKD
jgi:uncharacterized protein